MASELRPTVVFKFVLNGPGVVIVVCSSGIVVVFNFVSVVICIVKVFYGYKKNKPKFVFIYSVIFAI